MTGAGDDHLLAVGDRFDADLAAGIEGATGALLAHIDRIAVELAWLQAATAVLAIAAATGAVVGIRARLEEYR